MKSFHQLTVAQQTTALSFALAELKECIEMGIVHFNKTISDSVLTEYATCAAKESFYAEEGDKVIYDIAEAM
jgi:hypothetical protein